MGGAKTEWMEVEARGWLALDNFVCAECVSDPYLKALIEGAVCTNTCDYCGRSDALDIASDANVVVEAVYTLSIPTTASQRQVACPTTANSSFSQSILARF